MAKVQNVIFLRCMLPLLSMDNYGIGRCDIVPMSPTNDFKLFIQTNGHCRAGEKMHLGIGCA